MSDIPTENYIAHLTSFLNNHDTPIPPSFRYYIDFMRTSEILIDQRKYARVVVKFLKEIKKKDNPRGLKVGEMAFSLNNSWAPTGRLIIQKTKDPKISSSDSQIPVTLRLLSTRFQTEYKGNCSL